jgi:hypothetical protein
MVAPTGYPEFDPAAGAFGMAQCVAGRVRKCFLRGAAGAVAVTTYVFV